eukprot:11203504-Lingulodinium_polyedra.AAC.1
MVLAAMAHPSTKGVTKNIIACLRERSLGAEHLVPSSSAVILILCERVMRHHRASDLVETVARPRT